MQCLMPMLLEISTTRPCCNWTKLKVKSVLFIPDYALEVRSVKLKPNKT